MIAKAALNGNLRSRQIVAGLLTEIINAACSTVSIPCPFVVRTGMHVLISSSCDPRLPEDIGDLVLVAPDVIRSCMKFLAHPWTEEQKKELCLQGAQGHTLCHCNLEDSVLLHDLHEPQTLGLEVPPILKDCSVITTLLGTVLQALTRITTYGGMKWLQRRFRAFKRYGSSGIWPVDETDLVPYGVEQTLVNLCSWSICYPYAPQYLSAALSLFSFVGTHTRPKVILSMVQQVPYLLSWATDDWSRSAGNRTVLRYRTILFNMHEVARLLQLLNDLDIGRIAVFAKAVDIPWRDLIALCAAAHNVYLAIMRIVPKHDELRHALEELGVDKKALEEDCISLMFVPSILHYALALPHDLEQYDQSILECSGEIHEFATAAHALSMYMPNLYRGYICGNTLCTHVFSTDNRRLRACAGCRHMFYCSRRCQKKAWKHCGAAHRDICVGLRVIIDGVESVGPGLSPEVFETRCRESGADVKTIARIVENLVVVYSR